MTYAKIMSSSEDLEQQGAFLVLDGVGMSEEKWCRSFGRGMPQCLRFWPASAGHLGGTLGITGDRPFFLYWQTWALGIGALGLGLLLGLLS